MIDNARFSTDMHSNTALAKDVLVIGPQMNTLGFLEIRFLELILCVGTGTIVGCWTKDADLGAAVSSGMAGLVSCVGAVSFLVWR